MTGQLVFRGSSVRPKGLPEDHELVMVFGVLAVSKGMIEKEKQIPFKITYLDQGLINLSGDLSGAIDLEGWDGYRVDQILTSSIWRF